MRKNGDDLEKELQNDDQRRATKHSQTSTTNEKEEMDAHFGKLTQD